VEPGVEWEGLRGGGRRVRGGIEVEAMVATMAGANHGWSGSGRVVGQRGAGAIFSNPRSSRPCHTREQQLPNALLLPPLILFRF
jgi:hypothetical protein